MLVRWIFWLSLMATATAALVTTRENIEQSHVALTLLLIVLGGSAGGGRALGYVLATVGFVLIDYFFQAPYGSLSVGKTLDWVVLFAFLGSAFVATELLSQARGEAERARRRTEEVVSLSRLGSETLRYAEADDALEAVISLIRVTLNAQWCTIRQSKDASAARPWTSTIDGFNVAMQRQLPAIDDRITKAAMDAATAGTDHVAVFTSENSVILESLETAPDRSGIRALGLPLFIESRLVGVLIVGADALASIALDAAQRRFIVTISYYAALGAERVRLATEAREAVVLREANRAKDEVLATVSHDFRTPLTTIKLLAHAARSRGEPAATAIEEQADRLADLVTNVLDLSRIRAGGVSLDLALNTAEDVIAAAASRAQGILRGRRIVTIVDLDKPALVGRFDFVQTLRIIGNLIDNAVRWSPDGAAIEVTAAREDQWLVISVADRGPGIAPAERERIFEAFYRPRSQEPDVGHSGLGLSIARRLAELQHGYIDYEPRDGGGSIFSVRVPGVDLNAQALAEITESEIGSS